MTAVISFTSMENVMKLDGSERPAAISIATLYLAHVNTMARGLNSTDDFSLIEEQSLQST